MSELVGKLAVSVEDDKPALKMEIVEVIGDYILVQHIEWALNGREEFFLYPLSAAAENWRMFDKHGDLMAWVYRNFPKASNA